MLSLLLCGRLVTRTDQRLLLTFGCVVNAISLYMMSNLTLGVDYWTLAFPRFIQGFALGFIFVPLSTLTLSTIARDKLVNATSAYNVLRNLGGSVGIALATTFLAQRSQYHQENLVGHVKVWDPATQARLQGWTITSSPTAPIPSPPSGAGSPCSTRTRWGRPRCWPTWTTSGSSPSSSRSFPSSSPSCGACAPTRPRRGRRTSEGGRVPAAARAGRLEPSRRSAPRSPAASCSGRTAAGLRSPCRSDRCRP